MRWTYISDLRINIMRNLIIGGLMMFVMLHVFIWQFPNYFEDYSTLSLEDRAWLSILQFGIIFEVAFWGSGFLEGMIKRHREKNNAGK
ncbi:MAG: hypothetical protein AB1553_01905 [Nitrospirota bacterium]